MLFAAVARVAEPADLQRLRVIVVVSVNANRCAAHLTRPLGQPTVPDGVIHGNVGCSLVRIGGLPSFLRGTHLLGIPLSIPLRLGGSLWPRLVGVVALPLTDATNRLPIAVVCSPAFHARVPTPEFLSSVLHELI